MSKPTITLYTRSGCPLCEKAKAAITELQEEWEFTFEEVDIEQDDELHERYALMIPVLHIDGDEVAYGFINKFDISERLHEKSESL